MSKIKLLRVAAACLVAIVIMPCVSLADNAVDVGITCWGQHDTIYASKAATVDFYFENDVRLGGMAVGFVFFSPDGATWQWSNLPNRYYSYVQGSRMPGPEIWDMAMGVPTIYDGDGISPDTIIFGGVALMQGLDPGPLEHMLSYHFSAEIPEPEGVYEFCIDSVFIPPTASFVFVDISGNAFTPTTLWESGGACFPVKTFPYVCGDVNGDEEFNVGDPIFLIAFIFAGGAEPANFRLGDANGDGEVDVGDVVYMLQNIFQSGPDPICP